MKGNNMPRIRIFVRGETDQKDTFGTQNIQNAESNEEEKYPFDKKIDTRDEIVRVSFKVKALKETDFIHMSPQLVQWLASMVENILSVTFRHILEQNLTILEGKAFAAKNILLNIKQTCEYVNHSLNVPIDEAFMKFLDNSLFEIISEVMNKYPQANTKGASHKLKAFIKQISNKENDQYDFLLNKGITINYSANGDYSSDIMQVINKMLELPQEQATTDTFIEQFHIFCNQLFFHASKKKGKNSQLVTGNRQSPSFDQLDALQRFKKLGSSNNIRSSLEGKDAEIKLGDFQNTQKEERSKVEASQDLANEIIYSNGEITEGYLKFEQTKGHMFASCQKIPEEAKSFTAKEIRSGQFRVYHASILRVMTKWAQELYSKIEEASDRIRHRVHKFKTKDNKLRFCRVEEKEYLYQAAVSQKYKIDGYLKDLKKENRDLQAIFSIEAFEGVYLKKFTNVGIFAGRLEEVLGQLTFKYLNRLIHSLLTISQQASEKISEHYKIYQENEIEAQKKRISLNEINLISLKVGDLIRGRYICLEHEFFNILALLYKIEEIDSTFLKIVKIKNRLQDKNNDILINLFFKNKVLCELQLAIFKQENKKQKVYSQFNHFLYELKRSEFGVLSALSNTVAQYDPVVSFFTFNRHKHPKIIKTSKTTDQRARNPESLVLHRGQSVSELIVISPTIVQKGIEKPFICGRCKNLRIVHNVKFYYRTLYFEEFCNECIQEQLLQSPEKCKDIIEDLFKYYVIDEKIRDFVKEISIWNFKQSLRKVKDEKELYTSFLQYGFVIEKGEKLPKVHFFKRIYNQMNNILILSTISGGQINNFLSINCQQEKNKYIFMSELDRFIFFEIRSCATSTQIFSNIVLKDYILQECEQNDMIELLIIDEQKILKKDYLKYIEDSFAKYHPTLYLNNYKFVLDYLNEYASDDNQKIKKKKQYFFKMNALHIINLELQSSEIKILHPVLTHFANLKEINLSDNYIVDLRPLSELGNLVKINISQNKVTTIEPLTQMTNLNCLIASHNSISSLQGLGELFNLINLDCSFNVLHGIDSIQSLLNLLQLDLSSNYIQSSRGLNTLSKLQRLQFRDNQIQSIEDIDRLSNLIEINFADNHLKEIPLFENNKRLQKLNLEDNNIGFISAMSITSLKELDLSNNCITKIENVEDLQNLQFLDLSKNSIPKIEGIDNLEKLKILNLSDNEIQSIQNLEGSRSLEQLRLTNNPIQEISNISNLKNLVKLDINYCSIQVITQLRKLKRLQILNLSHNQLSAIDRIDQLVRVEKLDLSHNSIGKIQKLESLKYLQNLSLMNNKITKIQNLDLLSELKWIILSNNLISRLQNLEELDSINILQAENNIITNIENLQNLKQLSELWLSFNQIALISNLDSLKKLKKLGLAHNNISCIQGLDMLTGLEFLDLQANCLTKLENLDFLAELKWLVVSLNKIRKIEGLDKLERLETLIFDHNQIEKIQNLDKLKRLTSLIMNYNRITKIQGLGNLRSLEKLYLGGNLIKKIQNLESLGHINDMSLCDNQITKMQNFKTLLGLKILNLSNNQIHSIEEIENLECLKKLDLSGNQIEVFNHQSIMEFINEINLVNNPLRNVSEHMEVHSNIKFFLNTLMQKFDSVTARQSQENKKHKIYQSFFTSENIFGKKRKDTLEEERAELIRTFTKTLITQL